ncbi:MAG: DUF4331 domain-containing protein [Actinomycetota bacterium]|nr:DUF4331 domain-containing protein [Actinomycetota bacterium]
MQMPSISRSMRLPAAVALVALTVATGVQALAPTRGTASSHREAPYIATDPQADNTDVYAFRSPDKPSTVTLISNWNPFQEPAGGPNFFFFSDSIRYYINVDNDGDARPDIRYLFRFKTHDLRRDTFLIGTQPLTSLRDRNRRFFQTYKVIRIKDGRRTVLGRNLPVPPNNIGPRTTPDYEHNFGRPAVRRIDEGHKVFAGQRDEPFFVDLGSAFDLAGLRPFNANHEEMLPPMDGVDGFAGFNIDTIAIQVPIPELTRNGKRAVKENGRNAVIGVWSSTERRSLRVLSPGGENVKESGRWVQISRLAFPLVNELQVPAVRKDRYNGLKPRQDRRFLVDYIKYPELGRDIYTRYYDIDVPPTPRRDLVAVVLKGIEGLNRPPVSRPSDQLRLNMATEPTPFLQQDRLGFFAGDRAGFPNGRRPIDDITDIELRIFAGGYSLQPDFDRTPNNILIDGVEENDVPFLQRFPYLAPPSQGYEHEHHRMQPLQ